MTTFALTLDIELRFVLFSGTLDQVEIDIVLITM